MMLMLNVPATFGPDVPGRADHRAARSSTATSTPQNTAGIAAALMGYAPGLGRLLRGEDRLADVLRA
jgi:hypothetical protein